LLDQRLPDFALCGVGEAGRFGDGDGQVSSAPPFAGNCLDCRC
jgi:hypothetical protein